MSAVAPKIKIDDTFGSAFIGALIAAMLYGLTTLQTYFYFINYPTDGIYDKLLVCWIWILDTVQVALVSVGMYYYLVTNYANPAALAIGHWSLIVSVALNVIISFSVQCFFTLRIYYLSGRRTKRWLTPIIALFVFLHLAFGIETVGFLFVKKELARLHEITWFAAMPFALFAVLSDILIAGALCVLLYGYRTDFHSTNTLLNMLIVYAINRCLLTSAVALAEVIFFVVKPESLWYLAIDFFIGKLYANSLLATLNTRRALTARESIVHDIRVSEIKFDEEARGHNNTRSVAVEFHPDDNLRGTTTTTTSQDIPSGADI